MLFLIIIFSLLLLAIYVFYKIRFTYWKKRGIPYPEPTILFGNVYETLIGRKSLGDCVNEIYRKYEGYPFVGYFKTSQPCLLIRDPEFIKIAVTKDFHHFADNEIFVDKNRDPVFGRNPFVLKGHEWKTVRGQLTPCFTSGKMRYVFPLIMDVTKNMIRYIDEEITKNRDVAFELKELCSKFTIDSVSSCAFGLEGKCFQQENSRMRELARRFLSPGTVGSFKLFLLFAFPWISNFLSLKLVPKDVEEELLGIIKSTLRHRKENNIVRNDFLDIIAQLKETCTAFEFTDLDVTAHAASFFADGYETSSGVMAFVLFELAHNPHTQVRLREEIEETLSKCGGEFTYEAISDMVYLNAVIEETLRKNIPVTTLNKLCTKDYTYHSEPTEDFKGVTLKIEEGTIVTYPAYALAHDPKYFDDPEKFDPDRFLDEKNSYKYINLPFGEGQRQCLGRRFGLLQIKVGVAQIIRNFELRVNAKTKLPLVFDPVYILLRAKGGLWINAYRIKK